MRKTLIIILFVAFFSSCFILQLYAQTSEFDQGEINNISNKIQGVLADEWEIVEVHQQFVGFEKKGSESSEGKQGLFLLIAKKAQKSKIKPELMGGINSSEKIINAVPVPNNGMIEYYDPNFNPEGYDLINNSYRLVIFKKEIDLSTRYQIKWPIDAIRDLRRTFNLGENFHYVMFSRGFYWIDKEIQSVFDLENGDDVLERLILDLCVWDSSLGLQETSRDAQRRIEKMGESAVPRLASVLKGTDTVIAARIENIIKGMKNEFIAEAEQLSIAMAGSDNEEDKYHHEKVHVYMTSENTHGYNEKRLSEKWKKHLSDRQRVHREYINYWVNLYANEIKKKIPSEINFKIIEILGSIGNDSARKVLMDAYFSRSSDMVFEAGQPLLYGSPIMAFEAGQQLLWNCPSSQATDVYLDMINKYHESDTSIDKTLSVVGELKIDKARTSLNEIVRNPLRWIDYYEARTAINKIDGKDLPGELKEALVVINMNQSDFQEFDEEKVKKAKSIILQNQDLAIMDLVAIKFGGERYWHPGKSSPRQEGLDAYYNLVRQVGSKAYHYLKIVYKLSDEYSKEAVRKFVKNVDADELLAEFDLMDHQKGLGKDLKVLEDAISQESWDSTPGPPESEEDFVSIAGIGGMDMETQQHIKLLLDSYDIENYSEGSVVYGVFVKTKDAVRATEILKQDAKDKKYFIEFAHEIVAPMGEAISQPDFLIDDLGNVFDQSYRIVPYLQAAIQLQSMRHNDAEELLMKWAQNIDNNEKIAILCRMLFDPNDSEPLRRPMLGGPVFIGDGSTEDWPLEPITFFKDIPICIVWGYDLSGFPEHGSNYLEYSINNGSWTKQRYSLMGVDEINQIIEEFIRTTSWPKTLEEHEVSFLRSQAESQ